MAHTILVIEDNALNMKLVCSLLRLGEYQVLEAMEATRGIELATAQQPDLILMDIQLPDMDGLTATRHLKSQERTRAIPVVALTSYAMPGDEMKAREAGCSGYITKPINTRTFIEVIGRYLNRSATPAVTPRSQKYRNRILIVDDDPLNVKLLGAKLPAEQFEVLTAFNGKEAVQKTLQEHPELILLDIMMPDMDGYEVSQWLKTNAATESIPIILVTALDGSEDKIRGFEAGADEFLNKPVNDIELLTRVHSLLRLKHYREQLLARNQSEKGFAADPTAPAPEERPPQPPRILLVEDDERDAAMIRNMFSGEPCEFERVGSGEEALVRLGQEPFDLVLLDVILPGMDGFDVCRQLKGLHRTREMQVILITALSDLNNKLMGVESGADDYLIKPVNSRELQVRVKVLLKKKHYLDQLRHKVEAAVHTSIHDGLTGLHNQTYFKTFLELEIKRAERQQYPIGLVIIDIDDFKKINDQLGHLTGDLIVRELAQLVKQSIREIDLSARYGGDEFAVLFPYASRGEVAQIVERIQQALGQWQSLAENPLGREPLSVSFSMGVAFYPEQSKTMDELIRRADEALYRAKKEGKNRCCFFEPEP